MSKLIQPVILKKSDRNDESSKDKGPNSSNHLKVLSKVTNDSLDHVKMKMSVQPNSSHQVTKMKSSARLMLPNFNFEKKVLCYLDNSNNDFLVVGVIGVKSAGKSTLMNIIADQNYVNFKEDDTSISFNKINEVFPTNLKSYGGPFLDMFVTDDRIIILDTSPLLNNQEKEMFASESEDIKMVSTVLQSCHITFVVHNDYPNLAVNRILKIALNTIQKDNKHSPIIEHVMNRIKPGKIISPLDQRIFKRCPIKIPDFLHADVRHHHDVNQIVLGFRERVMMMKRVTINAETPDEPFTEKSWIQKLSRQTAQFEDNYFIGRYVTIRDRFHQSLEVSTENPYPSADK
ncbi:CLUMA_CG021217, isoform A [Clunio marinus]|uniref:CLUMA_CG021217, isoform A n=1 Tax=Clunio marinus TaxID=568069 RepID=A0A1J1JAP5_9DIPT|nr:CLUMA_CG021217, isoform A [Clunio marinus]